MGDKRKMSEDEILNAVEQAERNALGWADGELAYERDTMLNYYNQEPYGNEVEGRSQIVTSEVADTVEWILPSLLKIFTSGSKAVEFEPQGEEDIEGAEQATEACNYVFYRQNPGFQVLYTFFKDALIQKNGYVKVYYDKYDRKKKERYQGLTDDELSYILQNGGEIVQHSEMPTGEIMLHDVVIEVTEPYGKVCMEPVPPEEILVSSDLRDVDVQKSNFFAHRRRMTISELNEMGYETEDVGSDDWNTESNTRNQFEEDSLQSNDADQSMRKVWVTEAYIRMDIDGDGIAELVKVIKCAKKVFEHEEVDSIPFAAITPIIMAHRHHGKSMAEIVADLQLTKSILTRQVLDNVYFTNSPRMAVLSNTDGSPQANLDDLLTVRPGGIVREYVPNSVRPLTIPFMANSGLQTMEYLDAVRENRTGVTRYNQGIDANSLNKTASGITQIMSASQQRIELIARIFAETGVKQIFKLILMNLSKYHGRELSVRLNNKFVAYDPRNWNTQMDMVINVGIGTGNKDQQLGHLTAIAQAQAMAMQMGGMGQIVTMKNIYNVQAKIAENAGFKNVRDFWTDPDAPPEEGQPNPQVEMVKQQMQQQDEMAKAAVQQLQGQIQQQGQELQSKQTELQAKEQMERMKVMANQQAEETRLQFEQIKLQMEADHKEKIEYERLQFEKWKAELDSNTKIAIAEISAMNSKETTAMNLSAANEMVEYEADGTKKPKQSVQDFASEINTNVMSAIEQNAQQMMGLVQQMSRQPKPTSIQRIKDATGILRKALVSYEDGTTREVNIQ